MGVKRVVVILVLVLVVTSLALCAAHSATCDVSSCGQAALSIMLLLPTYLLLYKSLSQIPIIASAVIGPLREPPRLA